MLALLQHQHLTCQADLILAKYTCLALRRIAGSQKKVKGALTDATIRLAMASPVFDRLRHLIEAPSDDKDWFGMAEQAINTIFVLGEQPDQLASSILQAMTHRTFDTPERGPEHAASSTPEHAPEIDDADVTAASTMPTERRQMASAVQLAQLIFVAGHCAIKQLIHLELVEREYKRRKTEADKSVAKPAAQDELDQVAGSVEDDVADAIHSAREDELLYGIRSTLAVFAPMTAQICSQPKTYKVCEARHVPACDL